MKNIFKFFWDKDYPLKSYSRLYLLIAISVYILGRIIDPGPEWLREAINVVVHQFNLEIIQDIKLNSPKTPTSWTGTGLALQLQLLLTWPIACFLAVRVAWMNRKGGKDFDAFLPSTNQNPSFKSWASNIFIIMIILMITYLPFQGSNVLKVSINQGVFSKIVSDTYGGCIFWAGAGWVIIIAATSYFYIIYSEYKLATGKRG